VLGASIVLRDAAGVHSTENLRLTRGEWRTVTRFASEPTQNVLPRVTFAEAVEDMVTRSPTTIRNAAERTATNISKLYGEGRVVAFAKSAEQAVTDRVQSLIAEAIANGTEEAAVGKMIKTTVAQIRKDTADWSEAYARMAFRTNLNTAVTAGRFRQAQDPDIAAVIPAFRFDAVGDADTRDNHGAADGLIFSVGNPVWNTIAPPLGYQCRCQVTLMTTPQLRRMGRLNPDGSVKESTLPSSAHPDEGFRHGRADLFLGVPA